MSLAQATNVETTTHEHVDVGSTAIEVMTATGTLYSLEIDNTANGAAVFLKLWDHAGPTVGTTEPQYVYKVPAGVILPVAINGAFGIHVATGLWMACVTTGGVAGSTAPTNDVKVTVKTS